MKKSVLIILLCLFQSLSSASHIWQKSVGPFDYSFIHNIFIYNNDFYVSENTETDYIHKYNKNSIEKLDTGFFFGKGLVYNFTQVDNVVFASIGKKIFLSYNAGVSWKKFDTLGGYNSYSIVEIVDSTIFLQAHEFVCLHKLEKGSNTLEKVYLDDNMTDSIYADIIIYNRDYLFAADLRDHQNGGNTEGKLYISKDKGNSWVLSKSMKKQIKNLIFHNNSLFAFTSDNGLYISKDYGETWTSDSTLNLHVKKVVSYKNKIFACGNQINISSDNGLTWEVSKNNGLDNQNCKDILINNDTLYFLTNNSIVFYSSDGGNKWNKKSPVTEDIRQLQVIKHQDTLFSTGSFTINYSTNDGDSWNMYSESLYSNYIRNNVIYRDKNTIIVKNDFGTSIQISTNYGNTWKYSNLGYGGETQPWIGEILIMGNRILLFSSKKGTHISEDYGEIWAKYDNEVIKSDTRIYKYFRINDSDIILYGKSVLYKTFNNGLSWEIENINEEDVKVHGYSYKEGNNIFTMDIVNNKIFKSTNLGRTFFNLEDNIELGVSLLYLIPYNGSLVLLTTTGVFVSNNEGKDWAKYEVDLLMPNGKKLYFNNGIVSGDYLVLTSDYGNWRAKLSDLGIEKITSVESEIERDYFYALPPFPQPTSSIVTTEVYLDQGISLSKDGIKVFDMNGTQVEKGDNIEVSGTNWPTTLKWDSSNQPPGVYFIVIDYGENTRAIKIIKE